MTPPGTRQDRAHGALLGLAIGDALGMPTQSMPWEAIRARYGRITGFVDASDDQPIAPGMLAGSITDDTEQALILANLTIEGHGHVDAHAFANALLAWEHEMIARGSVDLLGPSTKAALANLQDGVPAEEAGRFGTTNGAAMRIAPIGIAHRPGGSLVDAVAEAARVTHNTGLGISAAAAIAAAVSAGIDGADASQALDAALDASEAGEQRGYWVAGASIPARFRAHRTTVTAMGTDDLAQYLRAVIGTSVQSQESVVAALLLIEHSRDDPFDELCTAASLGGDTDTIAAMTGAVLGAIHGSGAFPGGAIELVTARNHLDLEPLAHRLLALRG